MPMQANAALVGRLQEMAAEEGASRRSRALLKAAHSLSLYPLRVSSGQQAAQLQHVGPAIADIINTALASLDVDIGSRDGHGPQPAAAAYGRTT